MGGADVYIHVSLNSALIGVEWSVLRPGCFTLGERAPSEFWIKGCVGQHKRSGPYAVEKNVTLSVFWASKSQSSWKLSVAVLTAIFQQSMMCRSIATLNLTCRVNLRRLFLYASKGA
jgi:hypothetical protein